ncbi:unnamed protein product, partial [Prorocentrum cordatum]
MGEPAALTRADLRLELEAWAQETVIAEVRKEMARLGDRLQHTAASTDQVLSEVREMHGRLADATTSRCSESDVGGHRVDPGAASRAEPFRAAARLGGSRLSTESQLGPLHENPLPPEPTEWRGLSLVSAPLPNPISMGSKGPSARPPKAGTRDTLPLRDGTRPRSPDKEPPVLPDTDQRSLDRELPGMPPSPRMLEAAGARLRFAAEDRRTASRRRASRRGGPRAPPWRPSAGPRPP